MSHSTRAAEILALAWHGIWAFLCLFCAANYVAASIQVFPFAAIPGVLGFHFKVAYWLSIGQVFMALCGFLWHVVGIREHAKAIDAA